VEDGVKVGGASATRFIVARRPRLPAKQRQRKGVERRRGSAHKHGKAGGFTPAADVPRAVGVGALSRRTMLNAPQHIIFSRAWNLASAGDVGAGGACIVGRNTADERAGSE
jgi:hypothetical protein